MILAYLHAATGPGSPDEECYGDDEKNDENLDEHGALLGGSVTVCLYPATRQPNRFCGRACPRASPSLGGTTPNRSVRSGYRASGLRREATGDLAPTRPYTEVIG